MLILMEEFDGEPTPTAANNALYDQVYAAMPAGRPRLSPREHARAVVLRLVASDEAPSHYRTQNEGTARKSA